MPATIRRSVQNSNVYTAYGIMSSHRCEISHCNVAARHMTEGLRLAVRVRHCVQPA